MTYRFLLPENAGFEIALQNNGQTYAGEVKFAEQSDPNVVWSILCTLTPCVLFPHGGKEFCFCIIEHDLKSDMTTRHWNGASTKKAFHNATQRASVLAAACNIQTYILREATPRFVFMQAYDANLPDRALSKYHRFLGVFRDEGYHIELNEPYHGRLSWTMERFDG